MIEGERLDVKDVIKPIEVNTHYGLKEQP